MASKIILVTGYAQTGKDTVGKAFMTYNPKFVTLSFAEPLKRAANAAMRSLAVDNIDFFNEEDKKKYREVLISIGRTARDKDKDVFVKILCLKVESLISLGFIPVITDWRYWNEYNYIANKFKEESVSTMIITRDGSSAAHQEEFDSILQIIENVKINFHKDFLNGDIEGINKWTHTVADQIL